MEQATSLSKLEESLFYLLTFEWGVTFVKAVPPAYVGNSKGKDNTYCISILNHKDSVIEIPDKGHCDYHVVVIANKKGDNLILLKGDVQGLRQSFVDLAPKILWKTMVEVDEYTDSLFPKREGAGPQGQASTSCSVVGDNQVCDSI